MTRIRLVLMLYKLYAKPCGIFSTPPKAVTTKVLLDALSANAQAHTMLIGVELVEERMGKTLKECNRKAKDSR